MQHGAPVRAQGVKSFPRHKFISVQSRKFANQIRAKFTIFLTPLHGIFFLLAPLGLVRERPCRNALKYSALHWADFLVRGAFQPQICIDARALCAYLWRIVYLYAARRPIHARASVVCVLNGHGGARAAEKETADASILSQRRFSRAHNKPSV